MEDLRSLSVSGEGKLSNRLAIAQVIAGLMQDPTKLYNREKYRLSVEDFPETLYRLIFAAIEHLATNAMAKINQLDIDQFWHEYPGQYEVFTQSGGPAYLSQALEIYDAEKFDYYYNLLKKCSLVNSLAGVGIDTRDIYDPDLVDPQQIAKTREKFDNMTVDEILRLEEIKLTTVKDRFGNSSDRVENVGGEGLRELKERFKKTPEMGVALLSPKLTTIVRGQRRGCLFIESAPSGTGKSRRGNGECCHLAVPEYYNVQQQQWVYTGNHERVLMISTELELAECQQMWLAFVSGVSETHIKDGRYEPDEEARVDKAIKLIENANLYFVSITNFDTDDIVHIIRKYVQLHQVGFVFFDYLGETLKITSAATRKSGVRDLRTDQVLLALSQALKDTAKTLGIYIWTASQLSGNYKSETKELDATYLRSAKSIADKVDAGMILMPTREPDIPIIDSYCARGFDLRPNFVIHVYKVRAGSYQNIKVYVYFDRGTCQMTDCFVTDQDGNILPIKDTYIERVLDDTKTDSFAEAVGASADSWDEEDF